MITKKLKKRIQIAVVGSAGREEYPKGAQPENKIFKLAYEVGRLLGQKGIIVITGGKTGIMLEASRGCKEAGSITIGVVKGNLRFTSNKYTDVEVVTGFIGGAEATIISLMADGLIVIGGGAGTLHEVATAYRNIKPIVLIDSVSGWSRRLSESSFLDERKKVKFIKAGSPKEAVNRILKAVGK